MANDADADGIDGVISAAASAQHAAFDLDQVIEELALVLETALPEACLVDRTGHGAGPVRRLQVLAGRESLLCERGPDGTWTTSTATLHNNVTGHPRPIPPATWVRTLRQRLEARAHNQTQLADQLRGLLG